jgi:hypothetical protein
MGGTLKTQSFEISSAKLSFKYKTAGQKCHQFCSMVKFVEQNCDLALFPPRAKLRFEVLFKKFHPKINLAIRFSTKSYLLNTIKLFSGHENRSLTKYQKPLQEGYP